MLECPICFEKMTDIAFPFSVPDDGGACNHSFCMGCMQGIYELSKTHGKFPTCPICRRTINSFVRNQLASNLVTCMDKLKVTLRESKERAHERDRKFSMDAEHMTQRIAELEGDLVKANTNNQGEAERSGHMRKMLGLLESEKSILSGHLQDIQNDMRVKEGELDEAKRRIDELEQLVQNHQEDSDSVRNELEETKKRVAGIQAIMKEREMAHHQSREERSKAEQRIIELEDSLENSESRVRKTLGEIEKLQSKVVELEQTLAANEVVLSTKKEEMAQAASCLRDMDAKLKSTEAELKKSREDEAKLERRFLELEIAARKSDSERANNGVLVSKLEEMLNKYKQETRSLEEEKYEYGKKIAELEGSLTKFKLDLRKTEDEKNGFKERVWKAERDAELFKKELERIKMEYKEKEDTNKQSGYLSGFLKTSMNLNPLSALWGAPKPTGPLVRSFSDLSFYERRGTTKDSCVWRGTSKATGAEFAIKKIIDSVPLNAQGISDMTLFREALILKKIDHPSITKLDSVVLEKGALYFTYSPFVSMDLDYASKTMKLNALQIKSITYQLMLAVNYLHRQELVHRNLKSTTVLMCEDCSIKLCGFSQARSILGDMPLELYAPMQPVNYTAPEVVLSDFGDSINWKAADIWSVGCIFAELLMGGEPLFDGKDRSSYLTSISNIIGGVSNFKQSGGGLYPTTESKTLQAVLGKSPHASHPSFRNALEVAQAMLKYDPNARSEASYILQHKYFADVITPADLSRGRELSREVTDACIPHFITDYCGGIV